jgi:colicin import membrane protein
MQKPIALPLTVTLLLHALIIIALALNLSFSREPIVLPPQPKIIEAKLVSLEALPAARATPKPTEAPPAPVAEPKPTPIEAPKPELSKPEPIKPQQPVVPTPKPDLEKQKQQEKEKQVQLEKEKQAQLDKQKAEQKKLEQQKQDAERKRKEQEQAEALHKKQQEDQLRKQREQQEKNELAKAMAAEDNAMAAERDQEAVASYVGMMQRDITNNWSRPPITRRDMQVTLSIQLIPSGDVISVTVVKSSGNEAFDQSAQNAVRRVGKFPYLKELADKSPAAFEKNFRRLQLMFTPEDLRQ